MWLGRIATLQAATLIVNAYGRKEITMQKILRLVYDRSQASHLDDIIPNDLREVEYYWKVVNTLVQNQYIGGWQSVE
jgi:hypothetical protein